MRRSVAESLRPEGDEALGFDEPEAGSKYFKSHFEAFYGPSIVRMIGLLCILVVAGVALQKSAVDVGPLGTGEIHMSKEATDDLNKLKEYLNDLDERMEGQQGAIFDDKIMDSLNALAAPEEIEERNPETEAAAREAVAAQGELGDDLECKCKCPDRSPSRPSNGGWMQSWSSNEEEPGEEPCECTCTTRQRDEDILVTIDKVINGTYGDDSITVSRQRGLPCRAAEDLSQIHYASVCSGKPRTTQALLEMFDSLPVAMPLERAVVNTASNRGKGATRAEVVTFPDVFLNSVNAAGLVTENATLWRQVGRLLPRTGVAALKDHQHESCAVVASSSTLTRTMFGADIDSHDAVFRVNEAPAAGSCSLYAGAKTTYRVLSPAGVAMYTKLPRRKWLPLDAGSTLLVAQPRDFDFVALAGAVDEAQDNVPHGKKRATVRVLSPRLGQSAGQLLNGFRKRLSKETGRKYPPAAPSAGFLAVYVALQICGSVSVYGFEGAHASTFTGREENLYYVAIRPKSSRPTAANLAGYKLEHQTFQA